MSRGVGEASTRRTQAERTASTRRRLLDAACVSLLDDGPHVMTLADVAARAGVTTGAVQRHFGTKSGLLLAVFDDVSESQLRLLEAAHIPVGTDRQDRFRAAVRNVWDVANLQGARVLGQLAQAAHSDPALGQATTGHHEQMRAQWAAIVARQVDPDLAQHPQLATALQVILMVMRGITAPPGPLSTEREIEQFLERTADLLEAGLTPNRA